MKTSPTQRTLAALRREGYVAAVTEHWNPHAKIRQDLFGFVDVLALRSGEVLAVQATSAANHAARRTKICGLESARACLEAGVQIEVWSWRKKGARWLCRREPIGLEDLPASKAQTPPQERLAIA